MAIDFPSSPSVNDTFSAGGVSYTWDGTVWAASGSTAFVQNTGGTITGDLDIDGKVGISQTSPATELDVDGVITIRNGSEQNAIRTTADGNLQFLRNAAVNDAPVVTISDEDGLGLALVRLHRRLPFMSRAQA